jgi:outer membrane protein
LHAQTKIGYISVDAMVAQMPETAKVDSLLQKFQVDSVGSQYAYYVGEYNRKDSMLHGKDSSKYKGAIGNQIRQELAEIANVLQNWQAYGNQVVENKQTELLRPIYLKVQEAIKAVAKEKGYTHVFNKEVFLVAPDGDDMIAMVAEKLKVKLNLPKTNTPRTGN